MEARKSFQEHIEDLYLDLLKMAGNVLDMIERTRLAFSDMDTELFKKIIESDDVVDEYLVRIEREGIEVIARQAPVAIDLRMIMVVMRIAQHLERTADNCVNINKALLNLGTPTVSYWIKDNIDEMFQRSINMLITAIDAFKDRDPEKAGRLSSMDETVDRINRNFLTKYDKESEEEIELVIRIVLISRFLERIADHAVDIGEYVKYMVTGELDDSGIEGV